MTRDEWLALAKRCEEAKGEVREIDHILFAFRSAGSKNLALEKCRGLSPEYTDSLDAISGLIEREIPGGSWQCGSISREHEDGEEGPEGGWARVFLNCQDERDEMEFIVSGKPTPTLALCAAFCRAMAEKAG